MKGISHFVVGVAAASCFPEAVQAGAEGHPLYFLLGGMAGLLPDTLDFKFSRFFFRHDMEVMPDPLKPDPQMIADAVALAVDRARDQGKPIRIKLNTIRLAADAWQRYEVTFDVPGKQVQVRYGPRVDTGQTPLSDRGTREPLIAWAPLRSRVRLDYQASTTIDIFDGPVFRMEPSPDGCIVPRFIPWHRLWSHSLVIGLAVGLGAAGLWGPLAGLVSFAAFGAHSLLDQVGYMGSSLAFPFRRSRTGGLQLLHSGNASANFWTVWLACLLIFWNLFRGSPEAGSLPPAKLLFYGGGLPAALFVALRRL